MADLQRLQGAGVDYERDGQRRAILAALAQNDCGPQYRAQRRRAQQRGLVRHSVRSGLDLLARGGRRHAAAAAIAPCACAPATAIIFPISFSTSQDRFRDDERDLPAHVSGGRGELFSHRNPGEDMTQAISISGQLYTEMPNAFGYRKECNAACSCKRPGESWADALKHLDDRSDDA